MPTRAVTVVIAGDSTGARAAFAKTEAASAKMAASLNRDAEATSATNAKTAAAIKKRSTVIVGAGVAAAGFAVKLALSMQEADAKIQGTAQITAGAAAKIGDAFLATAGKSTFSGEKMAVAFAPVSAVIQTLAGHTLTAADAMRVMRSATDLAEASGQPLETTTADLAAVMQSFHLRLTGAAGAANDLFNTSRLTNVGLDTLTATVDKLHGKLGIASPSLEQTSALMVDLAQHGIAGSRGLLIVNSAMTTLLGQSKGTSNELRTLGVHVYDASGRFVGMQSVLGQLTPKLADMSDKQRRAAESALFGHAAAAALNLTILAGAKGFDTARVAVGKHNAVTAAAAVNAGTLAGKAKTMRASLADAATTIGTDLIPQLTTVVGFVGAHVRVFEVLAGAILGVAAAVKIVALAQAAWITGMALVSAAVSAMETVYIAAMIAMDTAGGAVTLVLGAVAVVAGVAAAAFHFFGGSAHKQVKPVAELTNAILADSDALGANTAAALTNKLQKDGLYDAGLKLGIGQRTLTRAAQGYTPEINQVTAALARGKHGSNDMKVAALQLASGMGQTASALKASQHAADNVTIASGHLTHAQQLAAIAGRAHLVVLGANTAQAGKLATAYQHLPPGVRTKVSLDDYASSKLAAIRRALDLINGRTAIATIILNQQTVTNKVAAGSAGHHAGGGTVHGPGTSKSDSVPMMLSDDEEVIQEPYASQNRALLKAINSGRGVSFPAPAASSAGGGQDLHVHLYLDGQQVQQSLLRLKRQRGGNLGLN